MSLLGFDLLRITMHFGLQQFGVLRHTDELRSKALIVALINYHQIVPLSMFKIKTNL